MSDLESANGFESLRPFVTDVSRPVYCLRNLPEEVVAVLFAYYSRSRETLRDNLLKLLNEGDLNLGPEASRVEDETSRLAEARDKARAFHEKWVVGYGHSSVAEHAVVHVAVENISILASKVVEDARLASFTEKSTRYVAFDTRRYYTPAAFRQTPEALAAFKAGIDSLMGTYDALMEPLIAHFLETNATTSGTERGRQAACRAQACDVLRYLLPAATHTNIGMTINARALEGLLVKMLSHPVEEIRLYGGMIKEEALKIVPTLIKYADRSEYRASTEGEVRRLAHRLLPGAGPAPMDPFAPTALSRGDVPRARLVRYDPDAEDRVLEALLYPVANLPADELARVVKELPPPARAELMEACLSGRGRHDAPLRALEETRYGFEIVCDYGAYRDIQRHRMAGQYPQPLTIELGYDRPPEIDAAGMAPAFDRAMEVAAKSYRALAGEFPEEAQYVVPLAYRKRFLMTMNLRELHHFVALRSARQGHRSYRRVAREVYDQVHGVHPALASYIRVDKEEYALSRS